MKNLKQHWKDFVGDPSEYVPQILIALGFVLLSYICGLLFYANVI